MRASFYIGTAGWNVPGIHARHFDGEGTHLVRYGRKLNCAEINSSFYREHKPETYRKWAASVPESFRFAVKTPRTITHEGELQARNGDALERFLHQTSALGEKRGPVLLQLPPKLAFDKATTLDFSGCFAGSIKVRQFWNREIRVGLARSPIQCCTSFTLRVWRLIQQWWPRLRSLRGGRGWSISVCMDRPGDITLPILRISCRPWQKNYRAFQDRQSQHGASLITPLPARPWATRWN